MIHCMVMPFTGSGQMGLHLVSLFTILSSVQEACRSLEKRKARRGRRPYIDSRLLAQPSLLTLVSGLVKRPGVPAAKEKRMQPEGKGAMGEGCSLRKGGQ